MRQRDGAWRWVRWRARVVSQGGDGRPSRVVGTVNDIHELWKGRDLARESQMRLQGIVDSAMDAIISIDENQRITLFNRAAERIFGYTAKEVIGCNVKRLMPEPYASEHDGYLARYIRERTPRIIGVGRKVAGRRKNGEVFPMRLAVTEIRRGKDSLFVGLVSDISVEEAARERIEFLALHDPLTSLPNRAHFNEALDDLLRNLGTDVHGALFIDLDGFKPINDKLGHEAGDEALRTVAGRLRNHLAKGDFVARLGGDEFVAIVRNVGDGQTAVAVAERLLAAISEPMTLLGQPAGLGASIGIALIPHHGVNATAVLTAADDAMYAAKRAGKGRVVLAGGGE